MDGWKRWTYEHDNDLDRSRLDSSNEGPLETLVNVAVTTGIGVLAGLGVLAIGAYAVVEVKEALEYFF